jgi:hypothetical protein
MLRLRDLLIVLLVLGAAGIGVYELGRHVDTTSANLASHVSELNQTQHVYTPTHHKGPSRRTIELAAGTVGGVIGIMVLFSVGSALARPRRRKTSWRAAR